MVSCILYRKIKNGAQGRNRTGTVSPPRDFKSLASTNFATWADDCYQSQIMEAEAGVEPTSTDLQSAV